MATSNAFYIRSVKSLIFDVKFFAIVDFDDLAFGT
jgi:hypothetical protein